MLSKENLKLAAVAVFCLLMAWTGPSIAHGVHASFAHNADKVDNKHAVGAGASLAGARGKLVAHDSTGRVPAKFLPGDVVTETEYNARPGTKLLAAGFVASNGVPANGFYSSGIWDATRTGTGLYRLAFRAPGMCGTPSLWPGIHLTSWHSNNAEINTTGANRDCTTGRFAFTVQVRNSAGALADSDWGFTVYGNGTTVGPVSATRTPARGVSSR